MKFPHYRRIVEPQLNAMNRSLDPVLPCLFSDGNLVCFAL